MVATPATGAATPQAPSSSTAKPPQPPRPNGNTPSIPSHSIPFSARRSAPLDMSTVERRGQPSSRDPPKRNRPQGIREAPTYKPTEEEWKDPMAYMRKIYQEASQYGICKLIPPEGWNPDLAVDLEVRLSQQALAPFQSTY